MDTIYYIDRISKKRCIEKVYGATAISMLYGDSFFARVFGKWLRLLFARVPFFSAAYGWWQKQSWTARKIEPFIREYDVDANEFLEPVSQFKSFNDFFIRKLKTAARPIAEDQLQAIMPADARYYFFQDIGQVDGFIVKGRKFVLKELLQSEQLAKEYENGTMVMARLCPSDYHRYHFPVDGIAQETTLINGYLYSVNPAAVKQNIEIFTQNKRTLCKLDSEHFGKVLFLEIGATNVGSINQTYSPGKHYRRGDEKGFFAFGGSALIMLFQPDKIILDEDLVTITKQGYEARCLMGQSLGRAVNHSGT